MTTARAIDALAEAVTVFLEKPRVLLGHVEPAGDAGGEEDAPEAVAGVSVVMAAATRSE
jgi:hypothetical protein